LLALIIGLFVFVFVKLVIVLTIIVKAGLKIVGEETEVLR